MLNLEQQKRFEELRVKGAGKTKEEKVEFEELSKAQQTAIAQERKDDAPEMVQVDKVQLESFLGEMKRLRDEVNSMQKKEVSRVGTDGWEEFEKKNTAQKARLRLLSVDEEDYVVTDWKFLREDRSYGNINLEYEFVLRNKKGKTVFHKMWFDDFVLQENFIHVDIVAMNSKSKYRSYGEVNQRYTEDYKTIVTDKVVPLYVMMENGTAVVKDPEFGEFEIAISRLNT